MAAASLRVPTLLFSGGQSPNLTQRIVRRLAAIIDGVELRHLPDAGHMLAMTHAHLINPAIAAHIARADELAGVPLAAGQPVARHLAAGGGLSAAWVFLPLGAPVGHLVSMMPETGK